MTAPSLEHIDPVCGMTVDPADAAGSYEYRGTTYYFCAESCLERFKEAPGDFVASDGHVYAPGTARERGDHRLSRPERDAAAEGHVGVPERAEVAQIARSKRGLKELDRAACVLGIG